MDYDKQTPTWGMLQRNGTGNRDLGPSSDHPLPYRPALTRSAADPIGIFGHVTMG